MYTPLPTDSGILYTGLSIYREELKKDLPKLQNAMKYNESYKVLIDGHKKNIKRINEILEELKENWYWYNKKPTFIKRYSEKEI